MCGINGFYTFARDALPGAEELRRTRDAMAARGPDGTGEWFSADARAGFGHRRLAIIDPSPRGAQPMATPDGELVITYNGEIYNYEALRAELVAEGVQFRTHTDTEVLLHLYRREGERMVGRLRGMFAFAIWDARCRSLVLARDPLGVKPLYYACRGGTFRFASQVKALLAGGGVSRTLDVGGLAAFLCWGSVREPLTIFEDIRLLPAGSTLRVTPSGPAEPQQYWSLATTLKCACEAAREISLPEAMDRAHRAIADSVKAHMVADVPVGAFLSAGLDSSTLVTLAQSGMSGQLQTITVTAAEFAGGMFDEGPLALRIASALGVAHRCLDVDGTDMEGEITRFLEAMDQPTVDGLNTWLVSKAAASTGLKVALSGLGGDELFGGYWTFRRIPELVARYGKWRHARRAARLARVVGTGLCRLRRKSDPRWAGLREFAGSFDGAYLIERGVVLPWLLPRVMRGDAAQEGLRRLRELDERANDEMQGLNEFARVALLESTRYMRNQLLRDSDWASMAHSLEIRVPFVDRLLFDEVAGLAATGRLGGSKAVLAELVPHEVRTDLMRRPKTGFTLPTWKWLRHSAQLGAWRRVPLFAHPGVRDDARWAYTLADRLPAASQLLR